MTQVEPAAPTSALADQSTLVRNAWVEQLAELGFPVAAHIAKPVEVTPQRAFAAGAALAQVHTFGAKFPLVIDNPNTVKQLQAKLASWEEQATAEQHSLLHSLQTNLARLAEKPPFDVPEGMGHGNFTPAAVSFNDTQLDGIGKWQAACADTWLYDLAIALNKWGFDSKGTYRASWFYGFLSGYENKRNLTPNERRLFNFELRRAAVKQAVDCLGQLLQSKQVDWEATFKVLDIHLTKFELADYAH